MPTTALGSRSFSSRSVATECSRLPRHCGTRVAVRRFQRLRNRLYPGRRDSVSEDVCPRQKSPSHLKVVGGCTPSTPVLNPRFYPSPDPPYRSLGETVHPSFAPDPVSTHLLDLPLPFQRHPCQVCPPSTLGPVYGHRQTVLNPVRPRPCRRVVPGNGSRSGLTVFGHPSGKSGQ